MPGDGLRATYELAPFPRIAKLLEGMLKVLVQVERKALEEDLERKALEPDSRRLMQREPSIAEPTFLPRLFSQTIISYDLPRICLL